jgi:hypothetical protein
MHAAAHSPNSASTNTKMRAIMESEDKRYKLSDESVGSNPTAAETREKLKDAAIQYLQKGLNVVPVKFITEDGAIRKKPIIEWKELQTRKQSPRDFEALPWHEAEGFALIGGDKTNDGLYVGAADYDVKNTTPEAQENGKKLLRELPVTQAEETISGGEHGIYLSHRKPKTVSTYLETCAVELLGENKLIVMAPSKGYKRLNDNTPTVVQDLESMFYEGLYKIGFKPKVEKPGREDVREAPSTPYRGEDPPCIRAMLDGVEEGKRDNCAIRLACYWLNMRRNTYAITLKKLGQWNKNNRPPLDDKVVVEKVKSAEHGGYVYGCNDDVLTRLCRNKAFCHLAGEFLEPLELVERELEKQKAIRLHPLIDFTPSVGLSLGTLLEDSSQSLLIMTEKAFVTEFERLLLPEEFPISISVRQPRFAYLSSVHNVEMLLLAGDLLSGKQIQCPSQKEVFEMLSVGIREYWWHSDERFYALFACWDIGTYFYVIFNFFPGLSLQGPRESGKTTGLEILRHTAWNPTGRETALRGADLFRTVEGSRVTYLIDITKMNPKMPEYTDILDIFEVGTEKGGQVRRINQDTGEPIFYEVYGPKALATRYELPFGPKVIRIITMKAPNRSYSRKRAEIGNNPRWPSVVAALIKAAIKYWPEVYEASKSIEQTDKLTGRPFNYWQPMLAICKVFAPEQYDALLKLAEEEAEKAERGDQLSEVEDAVLIFLMQKEGTSISLLLKDLTEAVKQTLPWVEDWHPVKSAIDNLGVIKKRYDTTKGVTYQFDLAAVKNVAQTRGIVLKEAPSEAEEKTDEKPSKLNYGSCEVCGKPGAQGKLREERVVYLHPECEGAWEGAL